MAESDPLMADNDQNIRLQAFAQQPVGAAELMFFYGKPAFIALP